LTTIYLTGIYHPGLAVLIDTLKVFCTAKTIWPKSVYCFADFELLLQKYTQKPPLTLGAPSTFFFVFAVALLQACTG